MADYEKKDLEKYLKNYISQLQGKSEKEQMDFLSNMRDKRTKEIKAEDPTVEVQYHPELDALGMLYQSVANGNDPKLEYEFDDDFTPPGAEKKMARKIRAKDEDYPFSDEENEDIYTAMYESGDPDYTDFYLKKYPEMRDKKGDIDYKYSTPELGKEYMKQHPELWKQTREWLDVNKEVDEREEKKYQEKLSKLDTNDNGKIEVDELADFQKSLDEWDKEDKESPKERLNPEDLTMKEEHLEKMPPNMRSSWENHIKKVIGANDEDELSSYTKALEDYVSKNKKGREDIPATYKR